MTALEDPARDPRVSEDRDRRFSAWAKRVLSLIYASGARVHRTYATRARASRGQPACKVVSVGGLTIGGAGKTPVAAAVARVLRARGHRVVLASRGYRGHARQGVTVVSDGQLVRAGVYEAGDEALLLAAHAPGVPVLVGRDRRVVGHHAVSRHAAEILVLDDGFQHHRLTRDVDIVCIDGRSALGNRRVVPAGPLREPVSALSAADWLCVVDGEQGGEALQLASEWSARGLRLMRARRSPKELRSIDGRRREDLTALEGREVGLLAGIARPQSLRRTLEALGAKVVAERIFPDHHAYRETDFSAMDAEVGDWITSEKDALKILPRLARQGRSRGPRDRDRIRGRGRRLRHARGRARRSRQSLTRRQTTPLGQTGRSVGRWPNQRHPRR